jgi:hypothetical protein
MCKLLPLLLALALAATPLIAAPSRAQPTDHDLLSTFCEATNIKGATCEAAWNYRNTQGSLCDVTLSKDRYSGRFIASGNSLLVVTYRSECENSATNYGGAVVFEEISGKFIFRSFQRGQTNSHCRTQAKNALEDVLVCITGHLGQGILETGVARMVFTRDFDGGVSMASDFLLTATDSIDAFGANFVTCDEGQKYFGISNLKKGPRAETVSVETSFADAATIRSACNHDFPKPNEVYGGLSSGDAYVPKGYEKHSRRIIDFVTRKITVE